MEKVSIIIPVYNGEKYVAEAIDSALSQTYENIEVIVINDGSIDKTEDICLSYGNEIRYYKKENGGVSTALNMGIELMKGDYFSWLSHDDLYYKDKIKTQINLLNKYNNKYKIVSSKSALINASGEIIRSKGYRRNKVYSAKKFFKRQIFRSYNGCGFLIHKDVFHKTGKFKKEYRYIQDSDMWFRIALNNYDLINGGQKLVKTRVHAEQATVRIKSLLPEEEISLIEEQFDFIVTNKLNKKYFLYLMLYAAITGNNKMIKEYKIRYNEHKKLNFIDKLSISYYKMVGRVLYRLKLIKRKTISKSRN